MYQHAFGAHNSKHFIVEPFSILLFVFFFFFRSGTSTATDPVTAKDDFNSNTKTAFDLAYIHFIL